MNNELPVLYVKDFSETPSGREPKDGPYNGQTFIKEKLDPMFNKYDKFIVNLDGIYGYASSFREESFGGLARLHSSQEVLDKITFVCIDEPEIIDVIKQEIKDANRK